MAGLYLYSVMFQIYSQIRHSRLCTDKRFMFLG